MSLSVRTYEANNAYGQIEEFHVDPATETVMDLLRKLRATPKLYNKHARVWMRLLTYHDHVPGALINDVERDPSVLAKTLSELQRAGVLQYEHDGTRLHILVDGCRDEREMVHYALEQSWRMEDALFCLARENSELKSERDNFLGIATLTQTVQGLTPDPNPAVSLMASLSFEAAAAGKTVTLRMLQSRLMACSSSDPAEALRIGNLRKSSDGSTPLHNAASRGNTTTVRFLVSELKSDVKSLDNIKNTPLHHAAWNGHTDTVRVLVTSLGSDVYAVDNGGSNPFHLAACNGHVETVRALVAELGSDVKAVTNDGSTALHLAAQNGHAETVRVLAQELGSNVKAAKADGFSPLHLAALNGHTSTVRALVTQHGSDVKAVTNDGSNPLHLAARNCHTETVRVLVQELGSDVEAVTNNGSTALHYAAWNGHTETVRVLVTELSADLMAKDPMGRTARDLWRAPSPWPLR